MTTVAHKSYSPDDPKPYKNGASSSAKESSSNENGTAMEPIKSQRSDPSTERWRLNYVPTPYDSSTPSKVKI